VDKRKPDAPKVPDSQSPTGPPPRPEMPTLPFDLSEYAREATGEPRLDPADSAKLDFAPDRVPTLNVTPDQLLRAGLDHKGGFLVSLIDGISTLEMIVDVAGMPKEEALSALQSLYLRRLIRFL
jgi:hypothetical protein